MGWCSWIWMRSLCIYKVNVSDASQPLSRSWACQLSWLDPLSSRNTKHDCFMKSIQVTMHHSFVWIFEANSLLPVFSLDSHAVQGFILKSITKVNQDGPPSPLYRNDKTPSWSLISCSGISDAGRGPRLCLTVNLQLVGHLSELGCLKINRCSWVSWCGGVPSHGCTPKSSKSLGHSKIETTRVTWDPPRLKKPSCSKPKAILGLQVIHLLHELQDGL